MTSEIARPTSATAVLGLGITLLALAGLRWFLFPGSDATVAGFGHDSAYLVHVADNVRMGRGYVNDAHWLVFLHPETLPMPYHNANPLYPTLMAWLAAGTDLSTVAAGFAISAASSLVLFVGLFFLVSRFGLSSGHAILLALAGTLFTPVFDDSLLLAPDMLCAALAVFCLACVVRTQSVAAAAGGGLFFGLAWLTRSSVVLLLPALVTYLFLWHGARRAGVRLAAFGLLALLTALPWLIHTAQVWGNPLRSDASYYLWQGYHARNFGDSVERFWHSTVVPPTFGELLRYEPGSVARFYLGGVPRLLKELAAGWCLSYRMAAFLGLVGLLTLWKLPAVSGLPEERRAYRPERIALGIYAATLILAFAPRWVEFETRYVNLLAVLVAMLLAYGGLRAFQDRKDAEPIRWAVHVVLLTLSSLLWLYVTPLRNWTAYQKHGTPGAAHAAYLTLAKQVHERLDSQEPVVVGYSPYFYTFVTGVSALSIPESDDPYLRQYMIRYGARHVFLTREELTFWRPHWLEPNGLPDWLRKREETDHAVIFERTDGS